MSAARFRGFDEKSPGPGFPDDGNLPCLEYLANRQCAEFPRREGPYDFIMTSESGLNIQCRLICRGENMTGHNFWILQAMILPILERTARYFIVRTLPKRGQTCGY